MQSKPTGQSLAAVLLWRTLATLALQLARMPPFLLVGSALLIGAALGSVVERRTLADDPRR